MKVIDRIRLEYAIQRYDFWLDVRGVPWRQRRELRRELRTNLHEASADVGMTRALFGIGSPKQLAHDALGSDPTRPRWGRAAIVAAWVFGLVVLGCVYTATVFTAGVEAAGVTGQTVSGGAFPWGGVEFMARVEPDGRGVAAGADNVQYYFFGLPLIAFLLVAQPWRALRRRIRPA